MGYVLIIFAAVFVSGAIGGTIAYILSLRNEIRHLRNLVEVWDHDYLNLNEMCSMMSQHYTNMMDDHEKALEELEKEKDDLRNQLEEAQEEIIKYKVWTKDELLSEEILHIKPLESGFVAIDNANSIREATKDLDFPPVDKVEDNTSDAISKFLNRQSKKED